MCSCWLEVHLACVLGGVRGRERGRGRGMEEGKLNRWKGEMGVINDAGRGVEESEEEKDGKIRVRQRVRRRRNW